MFYRPLCSKAQCSDVDGLLTWRQEAAMLKSAFQRGVTWGNCTNAISIQAVHSGNCRKHWVAQGGLSQSGGVNSCAPASCFLHFLQFVSHQSVSFRPSHFILSPVSSAFFQVDYSSEYLLIAQRGGRVLGGKMC